MQYIHTRRSLLRVLMLGILALSFNASFAGTDRAQDQLLFAKIYSNVRYFYPDKHISKRPWQQFLLKNLPNIPSRDTLSVFLSDITNRFERDGIHVQLYNHNPVAVNTSSENVNGYYWSYKGFGESHNEAVAGKLFGFFYDVFGNAYPKHFKKVTAQYLEKIKDNKLLSFDANKLYVRIEDSVWLGIPWQAQRISNDKLNQPFSVSDTAGKHPFAHQYLTTIWSALYQFYPSPVLMDWDSNFVLTYHRLQEGYSSLDVMRSLSIPTQDAHTNFMQYYDRGIYIEYLDGHLRVFSYDSTISNKDLFCAYLLRVDGKDAIPEFQREVALNAGHNLITRQQQACAQLIGNHLDSVLELTLLDKNMRDTIHLALHPKFKRGHYLPEPVSAEKRMVSEPNICYLNLSKTSNRLLKRKLKDDTYTAYILDIRNHYRFSLFNMLGKFVQHTVKDNSYTYPIVEYPGKAVSQTVNEGDSIKPKRSKLPKKELVFICDEMALSSEETLLSEVKYAHIGTIIGRPTAGTTGNVVMLQAAKRKYPDFYPFTAMMVSSPDGTPWTGVTPDIAVARTANDLCSQRDEILEAAIKYIKEKK